MTETRLYSYSPDELDRLKTFRESVAEFKALISALPADYRSADHNRQFNLLRSEGLELLRTPFSDDVPEANASLSSQSSSISLIVVLGVILALLGLGINAIILEDVLINSLGCCVSSGGMLLVIGAFGILAMKNVRGKMTAAADLNYLCDLLLYEVDHRLSMIGEYPADIPGTADFGAGASQ
jgi:hypothetical protein